LQCVALGPVERLWPRDGSGPICRNCEVT